MFGRFLALVAVVCASIALARKDVPFQPSRIVETMVPMRDGVELHTVVFFPRDKRRDKDNHSGENKFTAIVDRSPYGYGDLEWFADIFVPFGFVAIGQDMRGTEKSQGNFSMWTSDGNDSRDLGDWIVAQEWSNGKIMTLGASADGIGSLQTSRTNPDWLAAQYIIWASSKAYQTLFPYGAYKQKTAEDWLIDLTMPNPEYVYTDIQIVHENERHTPFWDQVELTDEQFGNVRAPSAFWAGWYDLFVLGTIQAFEGYNQLSDPSVRWTSKITVDPCGHCLDMADFFTENAVLGRTAVVFGQMFETFGVIPSTYRSGIKNVTFYVMSSNDEAGKAAGQYWTSLETWPAARSVNYYFHADKTLSSKLPSSEGEKSTTYKYDPADPVPTLGGNNLPDSIGGSIPCGPWDQSSADARDDVLTFQTEVMTEELAISGGIMATLYVSSDAKDTDFMVKISDVYPTGEARILQDNALRMRWRESLYEDPVYMVKNKVYKIEFDLSNTSYVVAPGHALRVSVSSSNFPRFSVNNNNGLLLADPAYPGKAIVAHNTVHHSTIYASHVTLPVIVNKRVQLPEVHVLKEVEKSYPMIDEAFVKKQTATLHSMMRGKRGAHKKTQGGGRTVERDIRN